MEERISTTDADEGAGLMARLRQTPLRLALLGFGAGFTTAWLLPMSRAEREQLVGVRARALADLRRVYDDAMMAMRDALTRSLESGIGRGVALDETAREQPAPPFVSMPAGFPFEQASHEYPLEESITVRRRLSTHDDDEEEIVPDLRNDTVGDEHPF